MFAPSAQLPVAVTWIAPTATDNTGGVTVDVNIDSGSTFADGTHMISYTATDDYGNTALCTFNIIITGRSTSDIVCFSFIYTE